MPGQADQHCLKLSLLLYFAYIHVDTTRIWDNPFNGMIRLMAGDFINEGRLEVYCNSQWGTVCDDTFDNNEAVAACQQLGYGTYTYTSNRNR